MYAALRPADPPHGQSIDVLHLFERMLTERSWSQFLESHGLSPLELRRLISHDMTRADGAWEIPDLPADHYVLILHNDGFTTQEFVVHILEEVLGLDSASAVQLMMDVHHDGEGRAGVFAKGIACEHFAKIAELATAAGFPLRVSLAATTGR